MRTLIVLLTFLCGTNFIYAAETPQKQSYTIEVKSPEPSGIWVVDESDIVSGLAGIVAILAFYVSYRRYETAKKNLLLYQPVLELFFDEQSFPSAATKESEIKFALILQNKGLSPAVIKDVSYLDKSIKMNEYSKNYAGGTDDFERIIEPVNKKIADGFFKGQLLEEYSAFVEQIKSFTFTFYPKIGDIISKEEAMEFGQVTLYPAKGKKIVYEGILEAESIPSVMYLLKLQFSESYNTFFTIHYKSLSDYEQSLSNINKEYFLQSTKMIESKADVTA